MLTEKEVRELIDQIGPHIDNRYDHTYPPVFPEGRQDVCAVKRLAEDGSAYGYDTIYVVWKTEEGEVKYSKLLDSSSDKDYIHIDAIRVERKSVTVKVSSGGSYSGHPWQRAYQISPQGLK